MKKFKAVNYIELTIAMLVIGVVFVIGMQAMRTKQTDKSMFFVSVWNNLMKANEELIYQNEKDGGEGLPDDYCAKLGDMLSVKSVDCAEQNIILPNGITISDLPTNFTGNSADITLSLAESLVRGPADEDNASHALTLYKADGMLVPHGNDLDSTSVFKFRVVSKETGEVLQDTMNGVSFKNAVCYMGVNTNYGVQSCNVNHNAEFCPYPMSCIMRIVMPKGSNLM